MNQLIIDMEKMSLIKEYSDLNPSVKQYYNDVVTEYSAFYVIHRQFLNKFILKGRSPAGHTGAGGIKIVDIIRRNEEINKHAE